MPTEKIAVAIPSQGTFVVDVACKPSDGDDEIALRMAAGFPPGAIFSISGVKWKSLSKNPPKVVELKAGEPEQVQSEPEEAPTTKHLPREVVIEAAKTAHVRPEGVSASSEPHQIPEPPKKAPVGDEYAPGQQWRPRDPRRKSGFTIKAITEKEVIAEDGRTIRLERMKRYDRVV